MTGEKILNHVANQQNEKKKKGKRKQNKTKEKKKVLNPA